MDWNELLSGYKSKTCIMSVEVYPGGKYGNIRIAAGNKAHYDDMLETIHRPFIPDSPYEEYFPKDKNFEDFCYRCAVLGQPLHSYVRLPQMDLWLNMILLPLQSDRDDTGYCLYSYDVTPYADSEQRTSLSADTSSAVLKTCLKLRESGDPGAKFREVIEDIRNICDSDYCGILLVDQETRSCTLLCDSMRQGCSLMPITGYLDDSAFDIAMSWKKMIGDSSCVIIKDQQDREWLNKVNPVWAEQMAEAGAESIVMFPLDYNDETLGYMWAVNFNTGNAVKIKETLELTTFFIASEISNYLLLKKLELLSSTDMLTGVKNRNSMNTVISDVMAGKMDLTYPCPVIFADLNGLKRVNDEKGHYEGDRLLKEAAGVLREVFPDEYVFRAGGDEFMILAPGMAEEEMEKRVQSVSAMEEEKEDLHFAIGTSVAREGSDIREAMHLADEKMYIDKSRYYDEHPERKYR